MMSDLDGSNFLPWITKFRPKSLDSIIGQENAVDTVKKFISSNMLPHLLFYGPPGTGKTSTATALGKTLYGQDNYHRMVLELNASDDRGIDIVRVQIKTFAQTQPPMFGTSSLSSSKQNPQFAKLKLIVLDEMDHMTTAAQMALRRIMEKYSTHVRFCLLCNDISLVSPAIQSRCTRYRFCPLPREILKMELKKICELENLTLTEDDNAMDTLVNRIAEGDFRKALNALQFGSLQSSLLRSDDLLRNSGLPNFETINECFKILRVYTFGDAFEALSTILDETRLSISMLVQSIYLEALKIDWPNQSSLALFPRLADIQRSCKTNLDSNILLTALIGAFILSRDSANK